MKPIHHYTDKMPPQGVTVAYCFVLNPDEASPEMSEWETGKWSGKLNAVGQPAMDVMDEYNDWYPCEFWVELPTRPPVKQKPEDRHERIRARN